MSATAVASATMKKCYDCKRPAAEDRRRCEKCLLKSRERSQRIRKRKRDADADEDSEVSPMPNPSTTPDSHPILANQHALCPPCSGDRGTSTSDFIPAETLAGTDSNLLARMEKIQCILDHLMPSIKSTKDLCATYEKIATPEANPLAQPLIHTTKGLVAHLEAQFAQISVIILNQDADLALSGLTDSSQIATAADTPGNLPFSSARAPSYHRPAFHDFSGSDSSSDDE